MASRERTQYLESRERVLEIYGNKCANHEECGNGVHPTTHHIIFKSDVKTGELFENGYIQEHHQLNGEENLCPLCENCHHELNQKIEAIEQPADWGRVIYRSYRKPKRRKRK
jgi:hypothetical protein